MNIFQTFQYATLYDASYNVIHVVDPDVILLQLDDLVYTPHMHVTQCTWIMKTIDNLTWNRDNPFVRVIDNTGCLGWISSNTVQQLLQNKNKFEQLS